MTDAAVAEFLAGVEDPVRRADGEAVCRMMAEETGEPPRMWGASIVGFGTYRMTYADGKQADWLAIGFAPRKASLVLYLIDGFAERTDALGRLGPHKTGKACLYVRRLERVDRDVLRELIRDSYAAIIAR